MRHTPGPWKVFIDDSGGQWTGWPLSVTAPSVHEDCLVVRTGGQWPYAWDYAVSQAEAVANARLIAAAPDLFAAAEEALRDAVADEMDDWFAALKAAVAKAKGQSE